MESYWTKAGVPSSRKISDQERRDVANRHFSLRRVTCKNSSKHKQLLAKFYCTTHPELYDDPASDALVVCLKGNSELPDTVEDRILDAFEEDEFLPERRSEMENQLLMLAQGALPAIDRLYTSATRISITTESSSNVTYVPSEENDLIVPLHNVPRSIKSLRPKFVQITTLKRLGPAGRFGLSQGIDRVLWPEHEGTFAFKHAGSDSDATTCEIEMLLQPPSFTEDAARMLRLSAVVTDAQGRLRGFISPFEPYGSLEEVFRNRCHRPTLNVKVGGDTGSVVFPFQPEWKDKMRWGAQLARGLATLHDDNAIAGPLTLRNLNPRNVLVAGSASASSSRKTYLVFAGLRSSASPTGMRFSRRWAAPERMHRETYEIGTALDVANLGMVLWALAEERFDGFPDIYGTPRRDSASSTTSRRSEPSSQARKDIWVKTTPATPGWYKQLVENCVEEEPARRPKAAEVAATLERQLQLSSD